MKKKNKFGAYEKGVIITGVAVLIIFLILLTADGIKNKDKNNNPIALSEQEEKITNTPNAPMISAGMIPVKYNGDNVIICKNDSSWYNYNEGTLAYMMLNDGVYQSELTVNMTNKKLANENIGQVVEKEEQGTIYIWIPRFAQKQNGEIGYIKEEAQPGGEWIVPDTFSYIVEDETKPNFSLNGIWIEKEPLGSAEEVNTKITNMNKENNQYGLIANTIVTNAGEWDSFKDTCLPYLREVARSARGF